jgi:hypothetical protein
MLGRHSIRALVAIVTAIATAPASAADYRGMGAGWPVYANGYYAANYPANTAAGAAYYVARPVATVAYAGQPPSGTMYMPVRAAYANPTYFAAYGRSPVAYRPVSTMGYPTVAGYGPTTAGYASAAGYAPTTAYYAPVTANYAPANSYAVTPAGMSSAGSEAAAYFGQPTPPNYVPPRVAYRTTYAAVPVYMYRPVTTYQPVMGQPVTCLQASTATMCQPQRSRCFSWFNPLTWFSHGSCGAAAPTTAFCGTGACGQPYYPTQPVVPVVPVVPAPTPTLPPNAIPATPAPGLPFRTIPAQPTVPAYPTRPFVPGTVVPGASGVITDPANIPPTLAPRTVVPGGPIITPITPGTTFPAQPGGITPINPGFGTPSFPTTPGAPGFGSGTNYAPAVDPYGAMLTPANSYGPANGVTTSNMHTGPAHSVFGSGYRGSSATRPESSRPNATEGGAIRAPELGPALPPSVQIVPDLDAPSSPGPTNSAPPLLDPRDKTAGRDPRWAVVPAQWPKKEAAAHQLSDRPIVEMRSHESRDNRATTVSPYKQSQSNAAEYDDRGWKSAAGF